MRKSILNDCLALANRKINKDPFKHYSFVVQNNKIISYGLNHATAYCRHVPGFRPYSKIHSEISAIRAAIYLSKKSTSTVINVRLNALGQIRISKPCKSCVSYLRRVGVTYVVYTTDAGTFERMTL